MAQIPIWKDKVVSIGTADTEFRITKDGVVIYTGKASLRPGAVYANVRINDICADHLTQSLPTLTDRAWSAADIPTFVVQALVGGVWTNYGTVYFYPDWSYDYGFTGDGLSFPINGRVDKRMWIFASVLEKSSPLTANYRKSDGTTSIRSATISPSPGTGTAAFKVNALANTVRITVNGVNHYVVTECAKYALYYVNAYGGWDQFLIEGTTVESDSAERFNREMEYDNTQLVNRGRENYLNEVTKSWTFNTGLLNDDEASRMHHLLGSCLIYLFDIATGDMIPVVMQTNTWDYKTFKNQGRKMFNYTFTVELAQNRIRR